MAALAATANAGVDVNSTITLGGTAQSGALADANRAFIHIDNNHTSEDLWVRFLGTAAVDVGIRIPGGSSAEWTYGEMPSIKLAMSIIAATTGHKYGITADVN